MRKLTATVTEMSNTDKIAAAVTAAVREDRKRTFSVWQKIAGAGVVALMAAPSAHLMASWFGWA